MFLPESRPKPNTTQIVANLEKFNRKVRWSEFFAENELTSSECHTKKRNIFKIEKFNLPKQPHSTHTKTFLTNIKDDILYSSLNKTHSNLTKEQTEGIKILTHEQKTRNIVIKPNDKNGGCSVLNFNDYVECCEKMLYAKFIDEKGVEKPYYRTNLPKDVLKHHWATIKDKVSEGQSANYISESDAIAMIPDEPRAGRFYGLVKNHVSEDAWPDGSKIPPLRPVVSGSGSNTENISLFVDEYSRQEVPKLPSFIEDSRHLLQIIHEENSCGPQPLNAIPVTMDINGMYNNIPWDQGILAFKEALDNRDDLSVPTHFLIELLTLVLMFNVFTFNGNLFMQLFGVAMGTRVAPTFACLFMGFFLEKILLSSWKGRPPKLWKRYIDDIIFLWTGSKSELLEFISYLNSSHPTIKFKCKEGEHFNFKTKTVNFLDMTIFIDDHGFIQTTLFTKPGKLCQYLLPTSCHPGHITKNIPYSLAYRLLRIESVKENLTKNLTILKMDLLSRNYSLRSIQEAFEKVNQLDRINTLSKKCQQVSNRITLVIPFHKSLPKISSILQKHWRILTDKCQLAKNFMPEPPMVCYTRDRNLRDILVRAKLPPPTRSLPRRLVRNGFVKCNKRGDCNLCIHSFNYTSVKCFNSDMYEEISLKTSISCMDKIVIYCI